MYKKLFVVAAACVVWATAVSAQRPVTVQLRDGSKVEGRIEELLPDGTLFIRVSQNDQRRIPISSVALIDRVGGASGLPETEIREAVGPAHLLLMSNGGSMKGQLVAIRGGQGSAQEGQARTFVFRTQDGREQEFPMGQVSRVYLGHVSHRRHYWRRRGSRSRAGSRGARRHSRAREWRLDFDRYARPQGRGRDLQYQRSSAALGQRQRSGALGGHPAQRSWRSGSQRLRGRVDRPSGHRAAIRGWRSGERADAERRAVVSRGE